jgi:hypothetical protein
MLLHVHHLERPADSLAACTAAQASAARFFMTY